MTIALAYNIDSLLQEQQHYLHCYMEFTQSSLQNQQRLDIEKQREAVAKGITLIIVPFWWDFEKERQ